MFIILKTKLKVDEQPGSLFFFLSLFVYYVQCTLLLSFLHNQKETLFFSYSHSCVSTKTDDKQYELFCIIFLRKFYQDWAYKWDQYKTWSVVGNRIHEHLSWWKCYSFGWKSKENEFHSLAFFLDYFLSTHPKVLWI